MITLMGEMSQVMLSASGPGRVAVSHGQAGELVVLPVRPGQAVDVGEGSFLAAIHGLGYTIEKLQGSLRSKLRSTEGFYMERFYATEWHGLLVLHAQGCAFERTLAQGEQLLVDPAGGSRRRRSPATRSSRWAARRPASRAVLFSTLAEGDQMSFGHRNLLWLDPSVRMDSVKTASSWAAIATEVPWRQSVRQRFQIDKRVTSEIAWD